MYLLERKYLPQGAELILTREDGQSGTWKIGEVLGEGASCICYSARCGETVGRLKEFYPFDSNLMRREDDNQLTTNGINLAYEPMRKNFLDSFGLINRARNRPDEAQVLNNFLPVQEILSGQGGSVYVWFPQDRYGITVKEYLDSPIDKRNFSELLQLVLNVAKFVRLLHSLGLLHLDIKPANVLLTLNENNETNPNNITIFDTDSIQDLNAPTVCSSRGTSGFSAPELQNGSQATNRCDIFSLGAFLYFGATGKLYDRKNYARLEQEVNKLKLVGAPRDSQRRRLLARIFRQSLAHCSLYRYRNVEAMIHDLEKLLHGSEQKQSDDFSRKIAVQSLLDDTPLFTPERNYRAIQIAILGMGERAKDFIAQAIECCQVPYIDGDKISGRELVVKIFCVDADQARENFLANKPALTDYIEVNGKAAAVVSYAKIDFVPLPNLYGHEGLGFCANNPEVNRRLVRKIFDMLDGNVQYVFVDFDDEINRSTAETFDDFLRGKELDCPVRFIVDDGQLLTADFERMGFNVHLSWLNSLSGVDMTAVREQYLEPYNHESSLAFALSIKYKLSALGIELGKFDEAARQFADKTDENLLCLLADFEHRRWIIEKIFAGWDAPKKVNGEIDYDRCLSCLRLKGKPQDDAHRLHPCILPMSGDFVLSKQPDKWNEPPDELDPLDRMSVTWHQVLIREAAQIKRTSFEVHLESLFAEVEKADEQVQVDFKKFAFYLRQIWSGNKNHAKNFKAYVREFKSAIPSDAAAILERLKTLRKDFVVIAESSMLRDYKINDLRLVKRIPFILTFAPAEVAMAFDDGRHGGNIFSNVAVATVLNPARLIYLYVVDEKFSSARLSKSVLAVRSYLAEKKIRADVEFVVAVLDKKFDEATLRSAFGGLAAITIRHFADWKQVTEFFLDTLKELKILFDGSTKLFGSAYKQGAFTQKIAGALPYFEFDFIAKKFMTRGCDYLNFIEDHAALSVADIFSMSNEAEIKNQTVPPIAADYVRRLWEIFRNDVATYMECIKLLERHDGGKRITLRRVQPPLNSLTYFFAESLRDDIIDFLTKLSAANVVENFELETADHTTAATIYTAADNEDTFDKIFDEFHAAPAEVVVCAEQNVTVEFKHLTAKFEIPADEKVADLLRLLTKERFLLNFQERKGKVQFRYASKTIKKLLSFDAIKFFVCVEVVGTGNFDDIACDVTFKDWRNELHRFDLVLTKSFASLMLKIFRDKDCNSLRNFAELVDELRVRSVKAGMVEGADDDEFAKWAEHLNVYLLELSEPGLRLIELLD